MKVSGANLVGPGRVFRLELAAGLHPQLLGFLQQWDAAGSHSIRIAASDGRWDWLPKGGVREGPEDEALQSRAFKLHLTKAETLLDTPHYPRLVDGVRVGCAVDCWPLEFDPTIPWELQPPGIKAKFHTYGEAAERHALVWGGRWASFHGSAGDQPHIEVHGWRGLPLR